MNTGGGVGGKLGFFGIAIWFSHFLVAKGVWDRKLLLANADAGTDCGA